MNCFTKQRGAQRIPDVTIDAEQPVQGRRLALLIANYDYDEVPELDAPSRDIDLLEDSLTQYSFEVQVEKNLTNTQIRKVISEYTRQLSKSDSVFFHFAGHGLEINGSAMILGTDFNAREQGDAYRQGYHVSSLVDLFSKHASKTIMVIDACRNNPFAKKERGIFSGTRSAGSSDEGLIRSVPVVETHKKSGLYLVFSTLSGSTAIDSVSKTGGFSPFVYTLVEVLKDDEKNFKPFTQLISSEVQPLLQQFGQSLMTNTFGVWSPYYVKEPSADCPSDCRPMCTPRCIAAMSKDDDTLKVGSRVRFKDTVLTPYFGWGPVTKESVGRILEKDDKGDFYVEFPEHSKWHVKADELIPASRKSPKPEMRMGSHVVRGKDWEWGDQDGGQGSVGEVVGEVEAGWVRVRWSSGREGTYRWGSNGKFDLKLTKAGVSPTTPSGRIPVGSRVRVKSSVSSPRYGWGSVTPRSVGTLRSYDSDGDPVIDFPEQSGWHAVPYEIELATGSPSPPPPPSPSSGTGEFPKGSRVRVKPSISNPTYGWGAVRPSSVGTLREYDSDGDPVIDFPEQSGWHARASEIELATGSSSPSPQPSSSTLPVGSRVKRGPDWKWGDQDGGAGGLGTVTSPVDPDSWVDVKWDSGASNNYRWGAEGRYDLEVVSLGSGSSASRLPLGSKVRVKSSISSPRYGWGAVKPGSIGTLRMYDSDGDMVIDFPEQSEWTGLAEEMELATGTTDEVSSKSAAKDAPSIGTKVKRGPDWQWGDQDGGAGKLGTVIEAIDPDGWIEVKWDEGGSNNYRWGVDGKYDLEIVTEEGSSSVTPKKSKTRDSAEAGLAVGTKVKRGPDWVYGDQDGEKGVGEVIAKPDSDGWVKVKWESGGEFIYRWGAGGKYDVQKVTGSK